MRKVVEDEERNNSLTMKSRFVKIKLHRVLKFSFLGLYSESERACSKFPQS